ncbi:MAG: tyrosine--tRNA ligase [Bacilli bacterium]|jgi:tyrosyl-tRNA synthetase|nr:tyrosine--tRNA ligase [Bacilli bacterium]
MSKFIEDLKWRGLIYTISDMEKMEQLLKGQIKVYLGVDPTADSMHIGHLVQAILLRRFQEYGHIPVSLMGTGTGRIGDPSGKKAERILLDYETIDYNAKKIEEQMRHILVNDVDNAPLFLDNAAWGVNISMFEFLRDYGKYFNINTMLAKDIVANRLETGISFTEFSYSILQAIDWLVMYEEHGVNMQIGGSDQWGNFTAGLDLIRKKNPEAMCVGLVSPLVTKADGTKFGKTETGTIWLDPLKTSPYEFYQFFLNTADADVINYLKIFTLLPKEDIISLEDSLVKEPHLRLAQKTLAKELTSLIHSPAEYERALQISKALFSGDIKSLTIEEINNTFKGVNELNIASNKEINVIDFLVDSTICKSKREAREFVNNNSITINGDIINDVNTLIKQEEAFNQEVNIVRKGKKKYFKVVYQ